MGAMDYQVCKQENEYKLHIIEHFYPFQVFNIFWTLIYCVQQFSFTFLRRVFKIMAFSKSFESKMHVHVHVCGARLRVE
jgi:hypothetical protein